MIRRTETHITHRVRHARGLRHPLATSIATVAIFAGTFATSPCGSAASVAWIGEGTNDAWSTIENWTGGIPAGGIFTTPAAANQDTATFNTNVGQMTVGIDIGRNIKIITFDGNAGSFTIGNAGPSGGEVLNLSANGSLGKIQMLAGLSGTGLTQTINAPLLLQPTSTGGTVNTSFANDSATASNVLNIAGAITSGSTTSTATINLTGANTGNNVISGTVSGSAAASLAVNKSGAGSWTIAGSVVTKGTGAAGGMAVTGGTITFASTANVNLTGKVTVNGGSTMNSLGTVAIASAGTADYVTIGDGSDGVLNVAGGTFTATPVTSKALVIGTADAVGAATGTVNVLSGSFILANNAPVRFGSWDNTTARHGAGILTISGDGMFDTGTTTGAFILGNGSVSSSGTINLDGGVFRTQRSITKGAGTATINFNGGTLLIPTTSTTLIGGGVNTFVKAGGAVIDTNGFNLTLSSALQADAVSTGGGLTKKNNGTLTLNGASNYTGPTIIEAGTLTIGASGSISGSSEIRVNSGAALNVSAAGGGFATSPGQILSGGGTIVGDVTLGPAAILAPGSSAGTLDINGSLSFGAASTLAIEIAGAFAGDGPGFYDQVNMTSASGLVTIDPTAQLTLALSGYTPSPADTFFVLTRADTSPFPSYFVNASEGDTVSLGGGYSGKITYFADSTLNSTTGGNDIAIYNVVPEPASATILLAGFGVLASIRPRRQD